MVLENSRMPMKSDIILHDMKERPMTLLSLQECMKLHGIEDWKITPSQERFLMRSTSALVESKGRDWVEGNKKRLNEELEVIFHEL